MERGLDAQRYYKRKFSGGRSAFARSFDYVALRLLIGLAAYVFYRPRVIPAALWPLTLMTLGAAMILLRLIREMRYARFVEAEKKRLARRLVTGRVALASKKELAALKEAVFASCGDWARLLLPALAPLTEDALALAVRSLDGRPAAVCALSGYTPQAQALADRYPQRIRLLEPEKLLALLESSPLYPSQEDLEADIARQQGVRRAALGRLRAQPFLPGGAKKYLAAAALLTLGSFFVGSALYYRLMASFCMALAGICFVLDRTGNRRDA